MPVTEFGISIVGRWLHSSNALLLITVMALLNVMLFNCLHPLKAAFPMAVMVLGISTLSRVVHLLKAKLSMPVTV